MRLDSREKPPGWGLVGEELKGRRGGVGGGSCPGQKQRCEKCRTYRRNGRGGSAVGREGRRLRGADCGGRWGGAGRMLWRAGRGRCKLLG
jgi:hypothetical protein